MVLIKQILFKPNNRHVWTDPQNAGKEKSLKSRYLLADAQKYKTRKQMKKIEDELNAVMKKKESPLNVKDILQDSVVETAFPNVQRLLKIYVLMPMSEVLILW